MKASNPISHLVVTWVLMLPLLYFAGGFWFQNAKSADATFITYGILASTPQTKENTVTILLIFTLISVVFFPKMRSIIHGCQDNLIFSSIAAYSIASCLWSQFPGRSFEWSVCFTANTLFSFYLYERFNPAQRMKLFYFFGWFVISLSFILVLFFPQYGRSDVGGQGVWLGVYVNRNITSSITILLLPSAFCISSSTWTSKVFRVMYICLSALLILMTQSATGKIVLILLMVYAASTKIVMRFTQKDKIILFISGSVIALAIIAIGILCKDGIAYLLGRDSTLSGRTEVWKYAMASITKRPILGYGYSAFWRGTQGESSNAAAAGILMAHAHNAFLEIWLELGAVGLGLFLYSIIKTFRNVLFCLRTGKSSYIVWCVFIFFLVIATNIDESGLIMTPHSLPWILYILACIGLSEETNRLRSGLSYE